MQVPDPAVKGDTRNHNELDAGLHAAAVVVDHVAIRVRPVVRKQQIDAIPCHPIDFAIHHEFIGVEPAGALCAAKVNFTLQCQWNSLPEIPGIERAV